LLSRERADHLRTEPVPARHLAGNLGLIHSGLCRQASELHQEVEQSESNGRGAPEQHTNHSREASLLGGAAWGKAEVKRQKAEVTEK